MILQKRQPRKWIRLHTGIYVSVVVLVCVGGVAVLLFPKHITLLNSGFEDMQKYLAVQKLEQEKWELQKTLAPGEKVVAVYEDQSTYFQVTDSCDWEFLGLPCVVARTGPGALYKEAYLYYQHLGAYPARVRQGQVFPMAALIKSNDGSLWYKIAVDRNAFIFPARLKTDWYVPATHFVAVNTTPIDPEQDSVKRIEVIIHTQELFAYEGQTLYMKAKVSTGTENIGLGTDTGNFHIWQKTPMAIMEGPLPSMVSMITEENIANFEYTLFVPYAMAFEATPQGIAYIHDAYWHNGFGSQRSHGCINLSYQDAAALYAWVPDPSVIKIPVTVLP